MALMGIDVGTTGCKVAVYTTGGKELSSAYREYPLICKEPGQAELDSRAVFENIKQSIREVLRTSLDIKAISVSSLGEAVVPVSAERTILGSSILNFDSRGNEYIPELRTIISDNELYDVNGNPLTSNYGLSKLIWIKRKQPEVYNQTYKFLLWSSFVLYMLGAEPVVDYALANRTLLLDINLKQWNSDLLRKLDFDQNKLPKLVPAGTVCGEMNTKMAEEVGLNNRPMLVNGTHDQCANALGCGVLEERQAMYGMGTFHCIVSVFNKRVDKTAMLERGLNTQHHALEDRYVSFVYNQGGILLKWYRDTFLKEKLEHHLYEGDNIYRELMKEIPEGPSPVLVLPHFFTTGPPHFLENVTGLIAGLTLASTRGDICKAILEGAAYYLKENIDNLPERLNIGEYRIVGGGSKSDKWIQLIADIFERPFVRTNYIEAGTAGAAILAGVGSGCFENCKQGVDSMVRPEKTFEPIPEQSKMYYENYRKYKEIYPKFGSFLSSH